MTARTLERNREQTSQRLLAAVGEVLARDGFAALGVNAVAREAGVDKVLIYRYFGGLPGLLQAWGASGRFWPRVEDLLAHDPALPTRPAAERWQRFIEHFVDELRARPLTLEILAAELQHRNEFTAILEAEREAWGEQAARLLGGPDVARPDAVRGVSLVVIAGVQYLLLRARRIRIFGGVDLRDDAGWARLKRDLALMAQQMMAPPA